MLHVILIVPVILKGRPRLWEICASWEYLRKNEKVWVTFSADLFYLKANIYFSSSFVRRHSLALLFVILPQHKYSVLHRVWKTLIHLGVYIITVIRVMSRL